MNVGVTVLRVGEGSERTLGSGGGAQGVCGVKGAQEGLKFVFKAGDVDVWYSVTAMAAWQVVVPESQFCLRPLIRSRGTSVYIQMYTRRYIVRDSRTVLGDLIRDSVLISAVFTGGLHCKNCSSLVLPSKAFRSL